MKIKTKKILAVILVVCLSIGLTIPAMAADHTARVINVFRTEGEVSLLSGSDRAVTPRVGQRLSVDDTLQTGENSSVHLRLDRETLLQMDENSIVTVESAGRQLVLSIEEGRALIHAEPQEEGNTIETRVGNVGLTIRGTMYTMGLDADGYTNIVMLSGSGDVNDTMLYAGNVMVLDEDGQYTLEELSLENLDPFTLRAVYDNMEYLMNAGTLTADMLPLLNSLVAELVIIIRPPAAPAPADTPVETPPAQDNRSDWEQDNWWASQPENTTPPAPPPADVTPEAPALPEPPAPPATPPVDVTPEAPETPDYDYDYDYDYDDTDVDDGSSGGRQRPPRNAYGVYQISTVAHLRWMQNLHWWGGTTNRTFELVNTKPLVINFMIPSLHGTFIGNGRTIDVRLCRDNYSSPIADGAFAVGLFGTVGSRGVVYNLNLITHVNVPNNNNVGGLAGVNYGVINNVTIQNNGVTGNNNVGYIVGRNRGTVKNVTVVSGQPVASAAALLDDDLDLSLGYDFHLGDAYDYVAPDNYGDPVDYDLVVDDNDNVAVDSDSVDYDVAVDDVDNVAVDSDSADYDLTVDSDSAAVNKDDDDGDDDDLSAGDDDTDAPADDSDDLVNP